MAQSSFYGGRQGASFVIVKKFDGINIPENTVHRYKSYATNDNLTNLIFYVDANNKLIEKNQNNYMNYHWNYLELDGSEITNVEWDPALTGTSGDPSSVTLANEYAEGMVQCFQKGGASTDIVNYGEYVIIDTLSKDNPDNGKVFRRGMNYQNDLGGAEYIGQIVGPQGEAPELEIDKYDDIIEIEGHRDGTYTVSDDDLVPGKYEEENISYEVASLEEGDNPYELGLYELVDEEYIITADTTVQEGKTYYTRIITPVPAYNDDIDYAYSLVRDEFGNTTGCKIGFKIPYLIEEFYTESRSPYYTNADAAAGKCDPEDVGNLLPADFNLIEQLAEEHPFYDKWKINLPKGIKGDTLRDLEIYPTLARAGAIIYNDNTLTTESGEAEGNEVIINYDPSKNYLELDDEAGYISIEDGWKKKIRYKLYEYDEKQNPEPSFVILGDYNDITDIVLDDDGTLTVYYTNSEPKQYSNKIKWITDASFENENEGELIISFNNDDEPLDAIIRYPVALHIDNEEEVDPDPAEQEITTGDQRLKVRYAGSDDFEDLGDSAINYIIDTYVVPVDTTEASYQARKGHLLVLYSDPVLRQRGITNIAFPSKKYNNKLLKGWTDLGDVQGFTKTPLVFSEYSTFGDIPSDPPEEIMSNDKYRGWGALYSKTDHTKWVSYYDYIASEWTEGVPYGQGITDPANVIGTDGSSLLPNGFRVTPTGGFVERVFIE